MNTPKYTAQSDELYKWQRSRQGNAAMKASKATTKGGENNTTNKSMTRKLRATIASFKQFKNASEGGGDSSTKQKAEFSDASGITLDHSKFQCQN